MAVRGDAGGRARLLISVGIAVVVAAASDVRAAEVVAPEVIARDMQLRAEEAYDRGEALAEREPQAAASRFADAGRLFLAAAAQRSGPEATTLRWYALKAYLRARALSPTSGAGSKAREICAQVIGTDAEARFAGRCAVLTPRPPPPRPPPPRDAAGAPAVRAPAPAGATTALPGSDVAGSSRTSSRDRRRGLTIGLWTAVAWSGALGAVALGTGLARVREPFQGAAYRRILDAAVASRSDASPVNDVASSGDVDMCAQAREAPAPGQVHNAKVFVACDRFDRLGAASVATGVAAGVGLVVTSVLLGVLLKRRRATGLRGRRAQLGVARLPGGGVLLGGGLAF